MITIEFFVSGLFKASIFVNPESFKLSNIRFKVLECAELFHEVLFSTRVSGESYS